MATNFTSAVTSRTRGTVKTPKPAPDRPRRAAPNSAKAPSKKTRLAAKQCELDLGTPDRRVGA